MTQTLYPIQDISTGTWAVQPLYQKVDDADDADYITLNNSASSTCEFKVTNAIDPVSAVDHVMSIRAKKRGTGTISLSFRWYEGTTAITAAQSVTLGADFADTTYTLSEAEANSITNYTNLRIRLVGVCNSASRFIDVAWTKIEVPSYIATITGNAALSGTGTETARGLNNALGRLVDVGNGALSSYTFSTTTSSSKFIGFSNSNVSGLEILYGITSPLYSVTDLNGDGLLEVLSTNGLVGYGYITSSGNIITVYSADIGYRSPLFLLGLSAKSINVFGSAFLQGNSYQSFDGYQLSYGNTLLYVLSDIDGDGYLEVVEIAGLSGNSSLSSECTYVILSSSILQSNGEISTLGFQISDGSTLIVTLSDINGDGQLEIIAVSGLSGLGDLSALGLVVGQLETILGNTNISGTGYLNVDGFQTSNGSTLLYVLSDIDGDGYLELVVSSGLSGSSSLSSSGQQNSYGSTLLYALADINGDGNLELISFSSLFGNSSLSSQAFQTLFGSTLFYLFSDINGDGYLELISSSSLFGLGGLFASANLLGFVEAISYLIGTGNLSIDGYQISWGSTLLYSLSDVDGDGLLEIVASSSISGLGSLLGTIEELVSDYIARFIGSGQASAIGEQTSYGLTLFYTLSDVNGDGLLELVADSSISGFSSLSSSGYQTSYGNTLLTVLADINGDGLLEVISQSSLSGSSNLYSEIVRLLLESGAFLGSGAISSTSQVVVYGSSGLSADGVLDSEALQQLLAELSLYGSGGLSSGSLSILLDSGILSGLGDLSVIGDIVGLIVKGCVYLFDLLLHDIVVSEETINSASVIDDTIYTINVSSEVCE